MYRTRIAHNVSLLRIVAVLLAMGMAFPPKISAADDTPVYTGILIDARHLSEIDRSPAPRIHGPLPASETVYPDPAQVPTPDEVQEQSVVRYYHSEEEARKGFVGTNPLIVRAIEVVGPAHDCLRLSAEDVEKLKEADKTIQFSKNWKVGFLLPADR